MSTITQRFNIESKRKKDNARTRALEQRPQARGWVNRVTIVTPRKPNSAKRPVIKVFLKRGGRLTAHIPGIGHTLKKFGKILVRGRGPRDLPGVRYSGIRGVLDFIGLKKKKRRRSIYGAEQNNISKIRARRKYRVAIRIAERERVKKETNEKIFLQETVVTANVKERIKENSQKHVIKNLNNIFFKNHMLSLKKNVFSDYSEFFFIWEAILFFNNFFFKVSYNYIYMYIKYITVKFKYNTMLYWDLYIIAPQKEIVVYGVTLDNKDINLKLYLAFFFKKTYIFTFSSQENYKSAQTTRFIPPKRQLNLILSKKKVFFFLKNNAFLKKKQGFLKVLSKKNFEVYNDLSKIKFFTYYYYNKYFYKKLFGKPQFFKNFDNNQFFLKKYPKYLGFYNKKFDKAELNVLVKTKTFINNNFFLQKQYKNRKLRFL